MPYYLGLLIVAAISMWGVRQPEVQDNPPRYFALGEEYKEAVRSQEVYTWQGMDSLLFHRLELLSNEQGEPLLFYSNINTPVCIDGACKPMYIEIYWNLLGSYVGYRTIEEEPLTKFDHDLFEEADHLRLHQLLLDNNSILKRKQLSDLFDPDAAPRESVTYQGKKVDAVSGATKREIKESVVEGALYSCFTIWHLVHGAVRTEMSRYIDSLYSQELAHYFLHSDYEEYQFYAIKHMDSLALEQALPRVLEIYQHARPLTRTFLLKKLPVEMWQRPWVSEQLYRSFSSVDVSSQTMLVNHLANADPQAASMLAAQATVMTQNQLKIYLTYLRAHPESLTSSLRGALENAAADRHYAYGYLIAAFLRGE